MHPSNDMLEAFIADMLIRESEDEDAASQTSCDEDSNEEELPEEPG